MRFEADEVTLLGGIRHGRTLGSPVAIEIANTEWPKWEEEMSPHPGAPSETAHRSATRARRPRRDAEVRLRRRPRRAREGLGPRDRSAGRGGLRRQERCSRTSGSRGRATSSRSGTSRSESTDGRDRRT